jgi:hypothetical protein
MLPVEEILRTALAEHDTQDDSTIDRAEVIRVALSALDSSGNVSDELGMSSACLTTLIYRSIDPLLRARLDSPSDCLQVQMHATRHWLSP